MSTSWLKQLLVLSCMHAFVLCNAQESLQPISLESVLELGGAKNLTIREYQSRQAMAMADYAKAREWWLPEIYAGARTNQLWGAAMNGNGRFFLDVSRDNLWLGLGLDARWDIGAGIFKTKAARLRSQAAAFQTQAMRNTALLESIELYYAFLQSQLALKAYQGLVLQADTLAQQIGLQVDAGKRYQSEWLLAKSNLSHLRIEKLHAEKKFLKRSAALIAALQLEPGTKLVSVDTVLSPIRFWTNPEEPLNLQTALQNRPDIKSRQLGLQAIQTEQKTASAGLLLPELRVGTYTSYFGDLNDPLTPMDPVAYPQTDMLYSTSALNLSATWRIPLGQVIYGGAPKQYKAKIQLEEARVEQAETAANAEIATAQAQLRLAEEQQNIAREGSEFAREALDQCIQRQALGTARSFEILQAQEIYLESRLDFLQAVASFNLAQYQIFVATGNNL